MDEEQLRAEQLTDRDSSFQSLGGWFREVGPNQNSLETYVASGEVWTFIADRCVTVFGDRSHKGTSELA
jgi:hypothetical protein